MGRFFKVIDPDVIKAFREKLELRNQFIKQWDDEAIRRGFKGAHVIHLRFNRLFDVHEDGFLATKQQMMQRDMSVYKVGIFYEKTNEHVIHVKFGNKKAYNEYRTVLPHSFDGEQIDSLFYEKPNSTWGSFIQEINWDIPDILLIESIKNEEESYKLNPCMIEIKQSEYLALQGK